MPTTPQHLADIESRFPELAAYRRTATRLHPRRGTPSATESNVGGPLLWPADEPWPVCRDAHEDLIAYSGLDTVESPGGDPVDALTVGAPVPLIPVAQLFRRDVPDFFGPPGTDLAQVLWCPLDHETFVPAVSVFWRTAAEVGEPLTEPPPPTAFQSIYVPAPCTVAPEQVTEYEYGHLLPPALLARIEEWEAGQVTYTWGRSITTGWKVGGFASWTLSDPMDMVCDCGEPLRLFLRVEGSEWDGDHLWVPDDADTFHGDPTGITIGRGYGLWIWVCPSDYAHPVQTSMQ